MAFSCVYFNRAILGRVALKNSGSLLTAVFCTLVKTSFRGLYKGFHWLVIMVGTGADREVFLTSLFVLVF